MNVALANRIAANLTKAFCLGVVAARLFISPTFAQEITPPVSETVAPAPAAAHVTRHANINSGNTPATVKKMADWVVDSGDNRGAPFVIVDKPEAKVFIFDKIGEMLGTASALVGLAPGDDSVPGIGTMPLTKITPDMRTTPAGRFVATLGRDLGKLDVLWVDYATAISLHRVINTKPAERRLDRIVSKVPAEHRISYGCINVPTKFFDSVVDPTFKDTRGIVYILPEVKEVRAVFPAYYDVDDPGKVQAAVN
jgi:hypothetical protein